MNKKIIYIFIVIVFIVVVIFSYNYYQKIFAPNTIKNGIIYITENDNLNDVKKRVTPFLKNSEWFLWVAKKKKFVNPKSGKYIIKKGMTINDIINILRSGKQIPVKVHFNNQDTLEKLAGKIAEQIEPDSLSLLKAMKDSVFLTKHHFTEESALGMYIPNSYELYWNTSAKNFRNRMLKESQHFWTKNRLEKAKKIGLTQNEVLTLASIIQKETFKKQEKPIIAGLYLNRLKKGWKLQSCPTVIFALKEEKGQNFKIQRLLKKDLKIISPYNTYKNKGLPPALIAMPDISSIDAVLNPAKHNYLYMCASVNKLGFNEFSSSLSEHNRKSIKYQKWLDEKGIRR